MAYDCGMPEGIRYEGRDLEAMSFAPNYHAWIADAFAPFLKGEVAEVGAGSGTFSALLLRPPVANLLAVEPSREMFPLLAERFRGVARVACRQAFFSDISADYRNHFDAIVYVNVLEHIADDENELRRAHESLKDGGAVCIFVPALSWLYSEHDRSVGHQRRYHKPQLKARLEKAGFEIVTLRYFDIVGILPWLFFMKWMKRILTGNAAARYDAVVVPVMRRLESAVPLPLGKNLIAVARKRR